jgi:hypothetical protein
VATFLNQPFGSTDSFGGQTVTFVTISLGSEGRFERESVPVRVDVPGCHFRPLGTSEIVAETDLATEVWKCTAPPVDAALNATAASELEYAGKTYHVTGVEPFNDPEGEPYKVTVIADRYIG